MLKREGKKEGLCKYRFGDRFHLIMFQKWNIIHNVRKIDYIGVWLVGSQE